MKRIIQTRLFIFMTLGLLSLLIIVYMVTAIGAKRQARTVISACLKDLRKEVTEKLDTYKQFRDNTDSGSLAKTRMLARIIQYAPDILKNDAHRKELEKVRAMRYVRRSKRYALRFSRTWSIKP